MTTLTSLEADIIRAALDTFDQRATGFEFDPVAVRALRDSINKVVIEPGDYVRSHDFEDRIGDPDREPCYVEGVVESVGWHDRHLECPTYKIRIKLRCWAGDFEDRDGLIGKYAYPPVNGTPSTHGRGTAFVELVRKGGPQT